MNISKGHTKGFLLYEHRNCRALNLFATKSAKSDFGSVKYGVLLVDLTTG